MYCLRTKMGKSLAPNKIIHLLKLSYYYYYYYYYNLHEGAIEHQKITWLVQQGQLMSCFRIIQSFWWISSSMSSGPST